MMVQPLDGKWEFRQVGSDAWLAAEVPGGVHTDLMALGMLSDPYVEDNELRVQWVAEEDWEYRVEFDADPGLFCEDRVCLVGRGLDTLARLTLNGTPLGSTDNMFQTYRWDVTGSLAPGTNELRIAFQSPVAHVRPRQARFPLPSPTPCIQGGPHVRKAPSQFGWDWGPKLPAIGIWKGIGLEAQSTAGLSEVRFVQHHEEGRVAIHADVGIERWRDADLRITLAITAPGGERLLAEAGIEGALEGAHLSLSIPDPQLWWPNGHGGQPLYDVEIALYEGNLLRDLRNYRLGLRTIELRQEPDAFGTSFTFVVNGVPIFAKGANWIPADSFPTRITGDRLEHLIRSSAQANMNMLRVWGGGFYEEERFYDLCDRYGILVWQDFIFSCAVYPGDGQFLASVRDEAIQNVRRLRHRASLALWCGNNEMEWGWVEWGWNTPDRLGLKKAYDHVFHHLLPEVCAAEDPGCPYWPSSPSSGVPFENPNGVAAGDTHNWEVWHRNLPFSGYRDHPSRFVSEFGFQSLPAMATIESYASEADQNMTSFVMEHHQRSGSGNGKMITYLTDHFRLPKDFGSLVYLTQLLQAEAMRVGVEHWRRNRDCTSGALYWQLNDCWPVASWSSIDYFGRWKALHYAARRFFAPVLLSAEEVGERASLSVANDGASPWQGRVEWSLERLGGEVIERGTEPVLAPALGVVNVCNLDFSTMVTGANRRDVVLVHELWRGAERISLGIVPFAPSKHLRLDDPCLGCNVVESPNGYQIELTARSLARFVWLDVPGADVVFSDNFFDLPAGRMAMVTLPTIEGLSVEDVAQTLRVSSLVDSF